MRARGSILPLEDGVLWYNSPTVIGRCKYFLSHVTVCSLTLRDRLRDLAAHRKMADLDIPFVPVVA